MNKTFLLLAIGCIYFIAPMQAQESKIQLGKSRLDISGGVLFLPEEVGNPAITSIRFTRFLGCPPNLTGDRPNWCSYLALRIIRIPPITDPWRDRPPIIVFPPPLPEPDPAPWDKFKLSELGLGESLIFAPSIGAAIPAGDRTNISIFAGGGFQYTRGRTTNFSGLGDFRTMDSTHPVLSFGAGARYGFSERLSVNIEFQGLYTFENSMDVIGPDASVATFEGGTMFMPAINAGLGINLN